MVTTYKLERDLPEVNQAKTDEPHRQSFETQSQLRVQIAQTQPNPKILGASTCTNPSSMESPESTNMRFFDYLPEVNQFVSFFQLHFYYQQQISDQEMQLKHRFTQLSQNLIMLSQQSLSSTPQHALPEDTIYDMTTTQLELINLLQETLSREDLPQSILKGALRTINKLFQYDSFVYSLHKAGFKAGKFLLALFECQIESIDPQEEEVILLTVQKIVNQLVKRFSELMSLKETVACCEYFFKVLKKKAISDGYNTSIHMLDGTKQNMKKLFAQIMKKQEHDQVVSGDPQESTSQNNDKNRAVKSELLRIFTRKLSKNVKKLEESSPAKNTAQEIAQWREYTSFIVKAVTESLLAANQADEEIKWLIQNHKELILEVVCKAGESQDLIVRNQGQQLFAFLMPKILELDLPMREELEVMYVKIVLKPQERLNDKLTAGLAQPSQPTSDEKIAMTREKRQRKTIASGDFLSDNEDSAPPEAEPGLEQKPTQTAENEVNQFELDIQINFLSEVLLSLRPEQVAQFFMVYDCQPFAENIIRRTLALLIKHTELQGQATNDLKRCFSAISHVLKSLMRYDASLITGDSSHKYMQNIQDMLDQKSTTKYLVKKANIKPKAFFQAIEEKYESAEDPLFKQAAAKVLLYSRRVKIDSIAEIIGGKDAKSQSVLLEYLERIDYKDCNIERSLRRFMQTFRMAGVDSQVVFRILEQFGFKYYAKDTKSTFVSKEEAYEFAYLIIVLQTVQHNAAIKEKTSRERFYTQAEQTVPNSYATLPAGFVDQVFDRVTDNEIKAPVTRDLISGSYDEKTQPDEIAGRFVTWPATEKTGPLTENEFLSTADLREKQLFEYSNSISGVVPPTLQQAALKQIVNLLTAKFCEIRNRVGENRFNQFRTIELTRDFIAANAHFQNTDWVDRLLIDFDKQVDAVCRISKFEPEMKNKAQYYLHSLFWRNFKVLKQAVCLIPKLAPCQKMGSSSFHYQSFNAVEYKLRTKYGSDIPEFGLMTQEPEERRMESKNIENVATPGSGSFVSSDTQPSGLFNMVYNYFTPATKEEEEAQKDYIASGQHEFDILLDQLEEFNQKIKGHSHSQQQLEEEKKCEPVLECLAGKSVEPKELIQLIATFIKENLHHKQSTVCLTYLMAVYKEVQTCSDSEKRNMVQLAIYEALQRLVQMLTRPKLFAVNEQSRARSLQTGEKASKARDLHPQILESEASETLSARSGNTDTMDAPLQNLAQILLKQPKTSPIDKAIATSVNKHLIMDLYLFITRKAIDATCGMKTKNLITVGWPSANDLIKDVQRNISAVIEDDLTREDFEESFLYERLARLLGPIDTSKRLPKSPPKREDVDEETDEGTAPLIKLPPSYLKKQSQTDIIDACSYQFKSYPKLPKFLYKLTILMLQATTRSSNKDLIAMNILLMLKNVSALFKEQEPIPFDQITLCLDIINKQCVPFKRYHHYSGPMINLIYTICENIFEVLEKDAERDAKSGNFELWFKVISILKQKIILSPYIQLFKSLQVKTVTKIKKQILTFQFQPNQAQSPQSNAQLAMLSQETKSQTKRIFQELLFTLSFDQLAQERTTLLKFECHRQQWARQLTKDWDDEMEGFAQLCQHCVVTMTDVFIYYALSIADNAKQAETEPNPQQMADNQEMFSFLWLNFLRVLLRYSEEAQGLSQDNQNSQSVLPLQQAIQENIQRVMEFLITQRLLLEEVSSDASQIESQKHELYTKSKEVIGAFWQIEKKEVQHL